MTDTTAINILPYIAVAACVTYFARLLPFLVFKDEASVPSIVRYIGRYLPPAIITGIVIYCFKTVNLTAFPYGAKELLAGAIVITLQILKRNMLISVFAGTLFYMIAVQHF